MHKRIGYNRLYAYSDGPLRKSGQKGVFTVVASFYFEEDVSSLFPYINAVADRAELYDKPHMIRFVFNDTYCAVYPYRCVASPLESREQVRKFADALTAYLADIRDKMDKIQPKHTRFKPGVVPQILKLLPGTNCGECGLKTCFAFAAMLSRQQAHPGQCPHMAKPQAQTYPVFDEHGNQVSQVTLHLDQRPVEEKKDVQPDIQNSPEKTDAQDTSSKKEMPLDTSLTGKGKAASLMDDDVFLAEPLTPRELEVLAFMGKGNTNPEISKALGISPHTVKSHVIHIFNKLGVNHRTQAVVWAARQGLI